MRPGVYAEWVVPHLDTGRWVTTGNEDAAGDLPPLIPKAKTVSMDFYRGSVPASVVSSFAPAARYEGETMEHRINGLDENTVASKTGNNDRDGGYVRDADAQEKGYDLKELRDRYPHSKKTLNHIYFDGNAYKTNPHFRFRPPWWSIQNPQFRVACVGDSLTFGWPCSSESKPTPYPTLLENYLKEVGIHASVSNFGISGARMWSGSNNSPGVVNYQTEMRQQTETKDNPFWFGNLQGTYDLMIIWLGTNDTWFVKNTDQTQVEGDFEKIMRYSRANHYLLVEIDGFRRKAPCPESPTGTINDETCKRDDQYEKAAECINKAIAALEQKYSNVHVASIDFMKDRCPGGETSSVVGDKFYVHFESYDGIARSIFGRIMCHAIFHRETGDLRWVGAEPNKKLNKTLPSL
jgi:lysophospholipase L1-like esterase